MPEPTEPVTGASVAADWGSQIHRFAFRPAGCVGSGAAVTMLAGEAYRDVPIDTLVTDPGGYIDTVNDWIEIPTDGAGWYAVSAFLISDGGATTGKTSCVLWQNGTERARAQEDNEGSLDVGLSLFALIEAAEGDTIRIRGRNVGTGTLPTVAVNRIVIARIGLELGIAT